MTRFIKCHDRSWSLEKVAHFVPPDPGWLSERTLQPNAGKNGDSDLCQQSWLTFSRSWLEAAMLTTSYSDLIYKLPKPFYYRYVAPVAELVKALL